MNKNLTNQVKDILEKYENTRNSDALLIMMVYTNFYYLPNPVYHQKLLEIMQYAGPKDIVTIRQKFNQDGRYLATSKEVLEKRRQKSVEVREELGYNTQKSAIINSTLDKSYQSTII